MKLTLAQLTAKASHKGALLGRIVYLRILKESRWQALNLKKEGKLGHLSLQTRRQLVKSRRYLESQMKGSTESINLGNYLGRTGRRPRGEPIRLGILWKLPDSLLHQDVTIRSPIDRIIKTTSYRCSEMEGHKVIRSIGAEYLFN